MTHVSEKLVALRETNAAPESLEARAAALVKKQQILTALSATRVARIRQGLEHRLARRRAFLPRFVLVGGIAALLILTRFGWAQMGSLTRDLEQLASGFFTHPEPLVPPRAGGVVAPTAAALTAPANAQETAPLLPVPSAARPAGARLPAASIPKRLTEHPARPSQPSQPGVNPLFAESRALAAVLAQREDPETARQALASYRRQFPNGALAKEADVAEVQVDLSLGDKRGALALLDRLDAEGASTPRRRELQVLHGELLAESGRCTDALSLWRAGGDREAPDVAERALFGEASCLATLGRSDESRIAFQQYLTRFPNGRFYDEARRATRPGRRDQSTPNAAE